MDPSGTARERLELPPVPRLPAREGGGLTTALPLLGTLGTVAVLTTLTGGDRGRIWLVGGLVLLAGIGFAVVQLDRQRHQRLRRLHEGRRDYLVELDDARATLRRAAAEQRRPVVGDDLSVRYGVGVGPARLQPVAPERRPDDDPVAVRAVARLAVAGTTLADLPLSVPLAHTRRLVAGGPDAVATARALVVAATESHRPERLAVAVVAGPDRLAEWEWTKWLPHAAGEDRDAVGPRRLVGACAADLRVPADRHVLLVVDGTAPPADAAGLTVLRVAPGDTVPLTADGSALPGSVTALTRPRAETRARRIAGRSRTHGPSGHPGGALGGVATGRGTPAGRLRVTLGSDELGEPVVLDLAEAAAGGVGPHGLLVGATGSGKSELLRTIVLQLARDHPPGEVDLVLVDFKGGATFAPLAGLPHVAGLVTNLADEAALVERMSDALTGELLRRQQLLRDDPTAEMSTLVVVVDEYAELLAARPELADLFTTLGRVGRSLRLHLLLSSQRLDEGRLHGLDAHLSYRIALRTFTTAESHAALGVPDAAHLPARPGAGYLRPDPTTLVRFQAPYLSRPRVIARGSRILPFTAAPVPGPPATVAGPSWVEETAAAIAIAGHPPARPVWVPPLTAPAALDRLLKPAGERLVVPVGLVDRPREQRHEPLTVDLEAGFVAVVGAPRSGRSTLLRTIAAGMAEGWSPSRVQLFLLDPTGSLGAVAGLPHVAVVASDAEAIQRVGELLAELVAGRTVGRGDDYGRVVVLADGWSALREYDDTAAALIAVAERGAGLGVHLVASATRWADFRAGARDLPVTRLELRLGDPVDSEVDRRRAASVPTGRPGHGLVEAGHFLAALPRTDGRDTTVGLADATAELVTGLQQRWRSHPRPRVRLLPDRVVPQDLPANGSGLRFALRARVPDAARLHAGGHLLVLGDRRSGRSTLLRALAEEATARSPADLQVVLVDPRRSLPPVPASHLLARTTTAADTTAALTALAERLGERLGAPTAAAMTGSGESCAGPRVLVLVDDLDVLAPSGFGPGPLQPLLPLLSRSDEVGLSVALARRMAGAARALHEPQLVALREAGATTVLFSGSPEEGPLVGGVRPRPLPPGRGVLVLPGEPGELIQVLWTADPDSRPARHITL